MVKVRVKLEEVLRREMRERRRRRREDRKGGRGVVGLWQWLRDKRGKGVKRGDVIRTRFE